MSDINETFFTSIGCMDGRVQDPAAEYGRERYKVRYADTITEAGIVGILANNPSKEFLEALKKKVLISVEKHHSKGIIVHGHQECAGNSVDDEKHKSDVEAATREIRNFISEDLEVKPIFIIKENGNWVVTEI